MLRRLIGAITWLLVAGSVAIILGGLTGRPVLVASVPTSSMEPTFFPGDLIPVLPLWGREPAVGQVIVFRTRRDRTWIVHRIVGGSAAEGYITRGDANPQPDAHRVFPEEIAGVVPAPGGRALRIPRLGLLSLERGPLSDPLVAGLALLAGLYLLVADARPGARRVRVPNLSRLRLRLRISPGTAAGLYAALCALAFLVTLVTTWSLSARWEGSYEVVRSRRAGDRVAHQALVGERKADTVRIANPSPVPLIVALEASTPDLWWEPDWFVLGPGDEREVTLVLQGGTPGTHTATLRQALYLPLLPLPALKHLAAVHWRLPAVATAAVPALAVGLVGALDSRVRAHLRAVRHQLRLQLRA